MLNPDHILVLLVAFVAALVGYCVLIVWTGDNPKFLEGSVVTLAGALAGFAAKK